MSLISQEEVISGQAIYSKTTLALYDLWVLRLSNQLIWKCPTHYLLDFYNAHISANHLDIGVGTGFLLDHCVFPDHPRIVLVDLNANSLETTAQRIRRHSPRVYRRNILEPLHLHEEPFDSIGMNYVLHCLPGTLRSKAVVFNHIKAYLKTGGIVFGSTLLQGGVVRGGVAKQLMKFYNRKGIFCNEEDNLDTLKRELAQRFRESQVKVIGCAALFWAKP